MWRRVAYKLLYNVVIMHAYRGANCASLQGFSGRRFPAVGELRIAFRLYASAVPRQNSEQIQLLTRVGAHPSRYCITKRLSRYSLAISVQVVCTYKGGGHSLV